MLLPRPEGDGNTSSVLDLLSGGGGRTTIAGTSSSSPQVEPGRPFTRGVAQGSGAAADFLLLPLSGLPQAEAFGIGESGSSVPPMSIASHVEEPGRGGIGLNGCLSPSPLSSIDDVERDGPAFGCALSSAFPSPAVSFAARLAKNDGPLLLLLGEG